MWSSYACMDLHSQTILDFSRFLGGWGVGMVSALVPTYVSECAPKAIRGRCTGLIQLSNNFGIMFACASASLDLFKVHQLNLLTTVWVNYSASKNIAYGEMQWRIPFTMQLVPGVLFLIALFFQPESPRWLAEHGKLDRAAAALAFATGKTKDDESVQETLREICKEFEGRERTSFFKQLKLMGENKIVAYRCFIGTSFPKLTRDIRAQHTFAASLVMFFQQWTGTNAINYYSPQVRS